MIARAALALVALACALAFGVWLSASRAEQRATLLAYAPPKTAGPDRTAAGLDDARAARRLSPDVPGVVLEALLLRRGGRTDASDRLLERAVRGEPGNTGAWLLLGNTTRDRALRARARLRVGELNPLLSSRGR